MKTKLIAILFFVSLAFGLSAQTAKQPKSENQANELYKGYSEGAHVRKYLNGAVEEKFTIKHGNLHGDRYYYYKSGRLFNWDQFTDGAYNGISASWRENGDTIYHMKYHMDTLLYDKMFFYYKSGELEGTSTVWYTIDSLMVPNNFKLKRTISGPLTDVGTIEKQTTNYRLDIEYYKSGKIASTSEFRSGLLNGKGIDYYENGKLKYEGTWANDKLNGEYTEYDENGGISEKGAYKDGKLHGIVTEYDEKGRPANTRTYVNGELQKSKSVHFVD